MPDTRKYMWKFVEEMGKRTEGKSDAELMAEAASVIEKYSTLIDNSWIKSMQKVDGDIKNISKN